VATGPKHPHGSLQCSCTFIELKVQKLKMHLKKHLFKFLYKTNLFFFYYQNDSQKTLNVFKNKFKFFYDFASLSPNRE